MYSMLQGRHANVATMNKLLNFFASNMQCCISCVYCTMTTSKVGSCDAVGLGLGVGLAEGRVAEAAGEGICEAALPAIQGIVPLLTRNSSFFSLNSLNMTHEYTTTKHASNLPWKLLLAVN